MGRSHCRYRPATSGLACARQPLRPADRPLDCAHRDARREPGRPAQRRRTALIIEPRDQCRERAPSSSSSSSLGRASHPHPPLHSSRHQSSNLVKELAFYAQKVDRFGKRAAPRRAARRTQPCGSLGHLFCPSSGTKSIRGPRECYASRKSASGHNNNGDRAPRADSGPSHKGGELARRYARSGGRLPSCSFVHHLVLAVP